MPCVTVVDVCIIRSNCKKVFPRFLMYMINAPQGRRCIDKHVTGTTRQRISRKNIAKIQIPLPPLSEQKRIARILDAADALRAKRRESLTLLDNLTQSIFLDMFGDPVTNPMGWEVVSLQNITTRITKGESPKWQGFEYLSHGALFVTSENVRDGFIDISKPKYIPIAFHDKLSRSKLRENDILINLVGASIGRSCLFRYYNEPANVNQAVAVISLNNRANPVYVSHLLSTQQTKNILLGNRVEAARANISLKNIKELNLPLPSMYEQQRFASIVESIEKQKERLRDQLSHMDTLFSSLQQRAFNGEL